MFMLRSIIICFIVALCSTNLVRLSFWKNLKSETLFSGCCKISGQPYSSMKELIIFDFICFIVVFILNAIIFFVLHLGFDLYSTLPALLLALLLQSQKNFNGKFHLLKMIAMISIVLILFIQDFLASWVDPMSKSKLDTLSSTITIEDKIFHIVPSLYDISDDYTTYYISNGKHIIYTYPCSKLGESIIIIDDDYEAQFLPLTYSFAISVSLQEKYHASIMRKLCICLDDNTPYGIFVKLKKTWLFGNYNIDGYIVLNLLDGTSNFYHSENELPDFVTN